MNKTSVIWEDILIELMDLDESLLKYVKERFKVKTMLDIGCGPGGMKEVGLMVWVLTGMV